MKTSFKYLAIMLATAVLVFTGCKDLEKMQKMADQVTLSVATTPVENAWR
jgi:predicted component of type VI protein secretion system